MLYLAGLVVEDHRRPGRARARRAAPLVWPHLHDYQRERILTFLDPSRDPLGAGYHSSQASIALGSGGVVGKGWLNGTQTHLDFLPERHTDFIFAVFGEEFGLIGNAVLLVLYLLLIGRGMVITANASTLFARLIAGAMTLMFFTYAFVNMGDGERHPAGGRRAAAAGVLRRHRAGLAVHRPRHPDERAGAPQARQHVDAPPSARAAQSAASAATDTRCTWDAAPANPPSGAIRAARGAPMNRWTISSAVASQGGSSASLMPSGVVRSPQRIRCEHYVRPPPNAGVSISEPGLTRPSSSASTIATGTVADDMLP